LNVCERYNKELWRVHHQDVYAAYHTLVDHLEVQGDLEVQSKVLLSDHHCGRNDVRLVKVQEMIPKQATRKTVQKKKKKKKHSHVEERPNDWRTMYNR